MKKKREQSMKKQYEFVKTSFCFSKNQTKVADPQDCPLCHERCVFVSNIMFFACERHQCHRSCY